MTASALAAYPELERLDVVEIEPAVVGAAPLLAQLNRNVLLDPRVHVTFDDARNFLFTTRENYDLIVSEPSNPWIAGVATLFTREFYAAVRGRLAPGGVFVQWMQAYSLYPEDLRMLFATFLSEFHGATLWHGDAPDLILMAPSPPSGEILQRAQALFGSPRLHDDFAQLGMEEPAGLFGFYLLDDAGLRKFSSGAQINTDDRTLLEYHAPRSLLVHGLEDKNRDAILRGAEKFFAGGFSAGRARRKRLQPPPRPRSIRTMPKAPIVSCTLSTIVRSPPTSPRFAGAPRSPHSNFQSAFHAFDAALAIDPSSLEAAWGLAETDRRFGNNEKARAGIAANSRARSGKFAGPRNRSRSSTWIFPAGPRRKICSAASSRPIRARAQPRRAELAEILLREGKPDEAYRAMQDCLALDPYNYQTQLNLGELLASQKKWAEARQHLEFVMRYFPGRRFGNLSAPVSSRSGAGRSVRRRESSALRPAHVPDNSELQRLNFLH